MGNQRSKGLTYFLMFVGLLLGGALTLVTILMLSPDKTIGGYTFVSESHSSKSLVSEFSNEEFNNVFINAGFYRVIISERDEILSPNAVPFNLFLTSRLMGVVKAENSVTNFNFEIKNGDLHFGFTKLPEGLLFSRNSCELNLVIYKSLITWHSKTVTIKTTLGEVILGGPNMGRLATETVELNSVSVETESGNITMTEKFTLNGGPLNLKTDSGTINFRSNLSASNIVIESEKGNLFTTAGKTLTGNLTTKGNIPQFAFETIIGNVTMDTSSGMWQAKKIVGNVSCTNKVTHTDMAIAEISGTFFAEFAETSNITLAKVSGEIRIISQSGRIEIDDSLGFIDIDTTTGNVILTKVKSEIEVTTTTGNITITYAEGLSACDAANLLTQRGKIVVNNAVGVVNAEATNNGTITAIFVNVQGVSELVTNSGALDVQIKIVGLNQFNLATQSGKSVAVDLGAYQHNDKAYKIQAIHGYLGSANAISATSSSGAVVVGAYIASVG